MALKHLGFDQVDNEPKKIFTIIQQPEIITTDLDNQFNEAKVNGAKNYKPKMKNAIKEVELPSGLQKQMIKRGVTSNAVLQSFHSPFRIRPNVETPTKRKDRNEWYRFYYKHHPIVQTAINTHASFPLSRFKVEHDNIEFAEFLQEMVDEINLHELMTRMAAEYYVVGECPKKGTYITMYDGSIKKIEDVRQGDEVMTHTGRPGRVTAVMKRDVDEEVMVLESTSGQKLKITKEHPIFTYKGNEQIYNENGIADWHKVSGAKIHNRIKIATSKLKADWVEAKDIHALDYVTMPLIHKEREKDVDELTLDKCRLLGMFANCGRIEHKDNESTKLPLRIVFKMKEEHVFHEIARLVEKIYDIKPRKFIKKTKLKEVFQNYCVVVDSIAAAFDMEQAFTFFGKNGLIESIADYILTLPKEKLREFVIGYLCREGRTTTDSHIVFRKGKENRNIFLKRFSATMASQFQQILLKIGMKACVKYFDVRANVFISRFDTGKILPHTLINHNASDLAKTTTYRNSVIHEDETGAVRLLHRLFRITKEHYTGEVYNLAVEGENSYIAGGIAVHNCFPFGLFDNVDNPTRWMKFVLLDPDKINLNTHLFAHAGGNPYVIEMEPEKDLIKIVDKGPDDAITGPLYRSIPPDLINLVRQKKNIPLPLLQVSHFKRTLNPNNARGESILSCVLSDLMYEDKLREAQWSVVDRHQCFDEKTECLTKAGWKNYKDLTLDDKIGTYNRETKALEYQKPSAITINRYDGEMIQFGGTEKDKKIDICVTPNHRMWAKTDGNRGYSDWREVRADEIRSYAKFPAVVEGWTEGVDVEFVDITCSDANKFKGNDRSYETETTKLAINDYLKLCAWFVTKGHYYNPSDNHHAIIVGQSHDSEDLESFDYALDLAKFSRRIDETSRPKKFILRNKSGPFAKILAEQFGQTCYDKKIPAWVKNLPPSRLKIFLDELCKGDAHTQTHSTWTDSKGNIKEYERRYQQYYTVSKQLADDVQEIAFKCGLACTIKKDPKLKKKATAIGYTVQWSETSNSGKYPMIKSYRKDVKRVAYSGDVWCVTVPNDAFVTRRNGKPVITLNSPKEMFFIGEPGNPPNEQELADFHELLQAQYHAQNQSYVFHHAVKYQIEGANGKILALQPEFDNINKRLYAGLGINEAMITSNGPSFASSSVAMDIMIGRYIEFRQQMEQWLIHSVFKPLCKIHSIYKKKSDKQSKYRRFSNVKVPDLPRIVWEKAQLRDEMMKIQLFTKLAETGFIPKVELLKLLNLSPAQMREEFLEQYKQDVEDSNKLDRIKSALGKQQGGSQGLPNMGGPGGPMGGPGGIGAGMPGIGLGAGGGALPGMGGGPRGGPIRQPGPGGGGGMLGGGSTPSPLEGGGLLRPPDSNRSTQLGE